MSQNLNTAHSSQTPNVHVTSFSGGKERGQMLQLHQRDEGAGVQIVHADKEQVEDLVKTLTAWLNR